MKLTSEQYEIVSAVLLKHHREHAQRAKDAARDPALRRAQREAEQSAAAFLAALETLRTCEEGADPFVDFVAARPGTHDVRTALDTIDALIRCDATSAEPLASLRAMHATERVWQWLDRHFPHLPPAKLPPGKVGGPPHG